jgi:hypothetical protein
MGRCSGLESSARSDDRAPWDRRAALQKAGSVSREPADVDHSFLQPAIAVPEASVHFAELPVFPPLPLEFAPTPVDEASGVPLTPLVPLVALALPVPFTPFVPVPEAPVAPGEPLVALVPLVAFAPPEPFAPAPAAPAAPAA